jgi:Protein of unknown function (DUF2798)
MPTVIHINSKFRKYINSIFIFAPMTFVMAFVGVMRNYGWHDGCFLKIIETWLTMFPIAFVCGLFIIPIGNKLTSKIHFSDNGTSVQQKSDEVLRPIKNEN